MARPEDVEEFLSKIGEVIPDVAQVNTIYKLVDEFITSSTEGLKSKNAELIQKNKDLKGKADGLDAGEIRSMLDELKGKSLEDYGNSIREETAEQVNSLQSQLSESQSHAAGLDQQYQSTLINLELRAAAEKARIRPEAIDDFVALHGKNFQLVEGQAVAGDLNTTEYIAGFIESAPYWWPTSVGGGLGDGGNGRGAGTVKNIDAAVINAAESGDMKEYRRIREKQKGG